VVRTHAYSRTVVWSGAADGSKTGHWPFRSRMSLEHERQNGNQA